VDNDRNYLELQKKLENSRRLRDKCVSGLRSLKRAHRKLLTQLEKRERMDYWYDELTELNALAVQLNELLIGVRSEE
jgi:hypothetical protein